MLLFSISTVFAGNNETISDIDIDELLEKQKDGELYLEDLKWNSSKKKFSISGYLIINDVNNTDVRDVQS